MDSHTLCLFLLHKFDLICPIKFTNLHALFSQNNVRIRHAGHELGFREGSLELKNLQYVFYRLQEVGYRQSSLLCFQSHFTAFYLIKKHCHANWTCRAAMHMAKCECANVDVHVCVCEQQQAPRMCSSRLDILFTVPTHWQSFLHCERHSLKHIQTSLPGSTVKLIYLSIAPPVCLSSNPFHHSVILLSVCLHSSVIIRQKNVTHTSSPSPIRLYTSLRSEPRGPRKDTHTQTKLCKDSPQLHHYFFCCDFSV